MKESRIKNKKEPKWYDKLSEYFEKVAKGEFYENKQDF